MCNSSDSGIVGITGADETLNVGTLGIFIVCGSFDIAGTSNEGLFAVGMLGISIVCGSFVTVGTSNGEISKVGTLGIFIVCGSFDIAGTSNVGIVCSVDEELVSVSSDSS